MQQQILDRDGPAQRHEIEPVFPASSLRSTPTFMPAKEGMYFADGIVEFDLAAIDQHHRSKAGDSLGQRVQRKDCIRRHFGAGIDVALAE